MSSKPTTIPRWADTTTHVLEPPEGKKDEGWVYGEAPASDFENWRTKLVGQWFRWVDERFKDGATSVEVVGTTGAGADAIKWDASRVKTILPLVVDNDDNFVLSTETGGPQISFKTIAGNTHIKHVSATDKIVITTNGTAIATFDASTALIFNNLTVSDANFGLTYTGPAPGATALAFDATDSLTFDRSLNKLDVIIGSANAGSFVSGSLSHPGYVQAGTYLVSVGNEVRFGSAVSGSKIVKTGVTPNIKLEFYPNGSLQVGMTENGCVEANGRVSGYGINSYGLGEGLLGYTAPGGGIAVVGVPHPSSVNASGGYFQARGSGVACGAESVSGSSGAAVNGVSHGSGPGGYFINDSGGDAVLAICHTGNAAVSGNNDNSGVAGYFHQSSGVYSATALYALGKPGAEIYGRDSFPGARIYGGPSGGVGILATAYGGSAAIQAVPGTGIGISTTGAAGNAGLTSYGGAGNSYGIQCRGDGSGAAIQAWHAGEPTSGCRAYLGTSAVGIQAEGRTNGTGGAFYGGSAGAVGDNGIDVQVYGSGTGVSVVAASGVGINVSSASVGVNVYGTSDHAIVGVSAGAGKHGVKGTGGTATSHGVFGQGALAATSYGVYGISGNGYAGVGVYGQGNSGGSGVKGALTASSSGNAVFADATGSAGYALNAWGATALTAVNVLAGSGASTGIDISGANTGMTIGSTGRAISANAGCSTVGCIRMVPVNEHPSSPAQGDMWMCTGSGSPSNGMYYYDGATIQGPLGNI